MSFTVSFSPCKSYCLMYNLHYIIGVKEIGSEAQLSILGSQLPALLLCHLGSYLTSLCLSFLINKIRMWAMMAETKVAQTYFTSAIIIFSHPHIRGSFWELWDPGKKFWNPSGIQVNKEQFWEGRPCPGGELTYGRSDIDLEILPYLGDSTTVSFGLGHGYHHKPRTWKDLHICGLNNKSTDDSPRCAS